MNAIAHHGLAPARTVMVGDRGADMVAARHHGLHALGASWGYGSREELVGAGAHDLCERPGELCTKLNRAHHDRH